MKKREKPYIVFTPFGFFFLGVILFSFIYANTSGHFFVFVTSFVLISLGFASMILTNQNISKLEVSQVSVVQPPQGFPLVLLEIKNHSRQSSVLFEVSIQCANSKMAASTHVLLEGNKTIVQQLSLDKAEDTVGGVYNGLLVLLRSVSPVGICVAWKVWLHSETLVFPKVSDEWEKQSSPLMSRLKDQLFALFHSAGSGQTTFASEMAGLFVLKDEGRFKTEEEFEMELRPFKEGDSPSRINWKKSSMMDNDLIDRNSWIVTDFPKMNASSLKMEALTLRFESVMEQFKISVPNTAKLILVFLKESQTLNRNVSIDFGNLLNDNTYEIPEEIKSKIQSQQEAALYFLAGSYFKSYRKDWKFKWLFEDMVA
jgi:hypothetical protein